MSLTERVPAGVTRAAVAAYVAWLLAVVLLVAGRYTPAPLLPGVEPGVFAGALAFTALGLGRGARWAVDRLR